MEQVSGNLRDAALNFKKAVGTFHIVFARLLMPTFLLCSGSGCSPPPPEKKVLGDLSGPWRLFVDDHLIEKTENVVRHYHAFEKHPGNPVLIPERPWEGTAAFLHGTTVLPQEEGSGYRMWYHSFLAGRHLSLYAISEDGLCWEKPELDLVEHEGSRANNIFMGRSRNDHIPQVLHTPWETDPRRRYKLLNYDYGREPPRFLVSGFWCAYSSDGLRWEDASGNPVLRDPGDVGQFVWDPSQRRYLGYTKVFAPVRGFRRRSIGFTATRDIECWPPAQLVLVPDEADDRWVSVEGQRTEFYALSAFPYESMYLGLLWIFRVTDGRNDGPIFLELATSRDGVHWKRQGGDRTPLLPVGDDGEWDAGMILPASRPLLEGDTLLLFYGGSDSTHDDPTGYGRAAIGFARLRKDGFASLDAGSKVGEVLTRPLVHLEGPLLLNADASRGQLRVEVLDAEGRVLPGYGLEECDPMQVDSTSHSISWGPRKDLPESKEPLRLRFVMSDASLFSMSAGDNVKPSPADPPRKIFLDFEGNDRSVPAVDSRREERGKLRLHNAVDVVQDEASSASGRAALRFSDRSQTVDAAEIPGTAFLGERFTLAAQVKTARRERMRLFSTHRGTGDPASGELILDFNPNSGVVRFFLNGQKVQSRQRFFGDGTYHQFAVTYEEGRVKLYVDADQVGEGWIRPGAAHLYYDGTVIEHFGDSDLAPLAGIQLVSDLRVGADFAGRFVHYRDVVETCAVGQLVGFVDDLLVAWRVFTPTELRALGGRIRE